MKIKNESIVEATEDIIIHQVNCVRQLSLQNKSIFEKFPDALEEYYGAIDYVKRKGYKTQELLGEVQIVEANGKYIVNMFSQRSVKKRPCDKEVYTDYKAMRACLRDINKFAKGKGLSIALPYRIGTGAPNGLWSVIEPIIEEELEGFVYYRKR